MIRIFSRTVIALAVASCSRDRATETPPPPPHLALADAGAIDAPPLPPSTARNQIAAGFAYGCIVTSAAKLACWGGTYPDRKPTVVSGLDHVAGVVAAQGTTCAWTTTGEVYCIAGAAPKRVARLSDVVEVATDPDHFDMCARRRSGRVACWTDFDKPGPVVDDDRVTGALAIAVAGTTGCMRDANGVACWNIVDPTAKLHRIAAAVGTTRLAGGGFRFVALRGSQPPVGWDETFTTFTLPKLPADVTQIALGDKHGCAVGHAVQCWTETDPKSLHAIANVDGAIEVAIGYSLGCARIDHHVSCWGTIGSLGDGTPIVTETPVTVANLDDATKLDGGPESERTCAKRAHGAPVCWGSRPDGSADPLPVDAGKEHLFEQSPPRVWSGSYQRGSWTCAKTKHMACTMTFFGRHQDTDTGPEDRFGNLDDARDLRMPSNLQGHMCVANAVGAVSCFEAFDGAERAVTVDGPTDVIQLAAYGAETCALERAGTVKCWDENARESSDGKVRTIETITDAVEIVGGSVTACARHKTGKVSCWGSRALLGDNADVHQRSAIVVAGVTTP